MQLLWLSHRCFVPVIKSKPSGMWSDVCYFEAKWEQVKSCPCFFGNPQYDFKVQSPGRGSMVAFAGLLSHGLSTQRKPHLPLTVPSFQVNLVFLLCLRRMLTRLQTNAAGYQTESKQTKTAHLSSACGGGGSPAVCIINTDTHKLVKNLQTPGEREH